MNGHGSPRGYLKSNGTPLQYLMFKFNTSNTLVGIEVRSLKLYRIPSLIRCSEQRELSFCRKRTQNVALPDPVGYALIQVNWCLNLTSALIATQPSFLYPNVTVVLSSLRPRLKKNTLWILSSGSVTIDTHAPSPLFHLNYLSVRTVTVLLDRPFKTKF